VTIYVSLRMEFKMAVAALVALLHDLIITAGIFALARFEVTPASVIALLTILGYSLYDTVVVFDKVRENTGSLTAMSRTTYSQATNLAVNQTMMRSLNTSLASLLPILGLLLVGSYLLGAETLKDLALALFVGVAAGAYSSIFIAPPIVAMWKEKEPRYAQLRARVERLAAQGPGAERPERPERPVRAGAGGTRARRAAAPPPEPEPLPSPELPPDDELEEAEAEAEEEAVAAQAPVRRQPQKPRPTQQRRKPSGRQQSRPAKRRRR
jgi:preprotein translocase subunit SecF